MEMKKSKKGQAMTLRGLATIGVLFIVIAITFGIGARITDDIGETMTDSENVLNETVSSLTTTTNYSVARLATYNALFSLNTGSVQIQNCTNDEFIFVRDTDFIAYDTGVISWINTSDNTVGCFYVNYTCSYCNKTSCSATANGTEGLGELASWLPTIAIIIAAAIIIGIVVMYFYVKSR